MRNWITPLIIQELGDSPGWTLLVIMTNFLFLISNTGSELVTVRMGTSLPARVSHSVSFLMKGALAGSSISFSMSSIMSEYLPGYLKVIRRFLRVDFSHL